MTATEDTESQQKAKLKGLTYAFLLFLVLAVVATLTAVVYLLWREETRIQQNNEIQKFIREQAIRNGELSTAVLDCTEPGGECYEDGRKRTAEAVVGINEGTFNVIVAALSCQADGIVEQRALARCTARRSSQE
jgi:hypothetical protein